MTRESDPKISPNRNAAENLPEVDGAAETKNSPAEWDERYGSSAELWSGQPNGALVAEVSGLAPGRALDVGCGEGADAIWLANQGWTVTALDVSRVALDRAERRAGAVGVSVRWVHAGLEEAGLSAGEFDLVSAQYPALLRTPGNDAERLLLGAVAPGGVLLFVHHAKFDSAQAADSPQEEANGFDPADYVGPAEVAAVFDADWQFEIERDRPRHVATGAGAHHTHDVVLRAQRLR